MEIPKRITHHLEEMDLYLDKMIRASFDHESIHDYREAIRRLRSLIYFYSPLIRDLDYKNLDYISKRNFDHTSLIREVDVFMTGYGQVMLPATKSKLNELKKPLLQRLTLDAKAMKLFNFASFDVRLKPSVAHKQDCKIWEHDRHVALIEDFIDMDLHSDEENLERHIHEKRTLVKKLKYIHEILMPDNEALSKINVVLEDFQDVARRLHDVCVNLRFVGQYRLHDPELFETLIKNHDSFLAESDLKYEEICRLLTQYITPMEA